MKSNAESIPDRLHLPFEIVAVLTQSSLVLLAQKTIAIFQQINDRVGHDKVLRVAAACQALINPDATSHVQRQDGFLDLEFLDQLPTGMNDFDKGNLDQLIQEYKDILSMADYLVINGHDDSDQHVAIDLDFSLDGTPAKLAVLNFLIDSLGEFTKRHEQFIEKAPTLDADTRRTITSIHEIAFSHYAHLIFRIVPSLNTDSLTPDILLSALTDLRG